MTQFARASVEQAITVSDAVVNATAVDFSEYSGAILVCPAGFPSVTVTPYVEANGTYVALTNTDGTAAEMTCAASTAVIVPVGMFAGKNVKFIRSGSGEVVAHLLLKK